MTTKAPVMPNAKVERILEAAADDLPSFVLDHGWFQTKDEHDPAVRAKPLPQKAYCYAYLKELSTHNFVIVPKSRQMTITWLTLAYLVAKAIIGHNLLIIVQTKREEDAESLIGRCKFYYDHFPSWLQKGRPRLAGVKEHKMDLAFPSRYTKIWGIPQGADVIRSNTVSIYYGDELDFQPEAKASVRAAMPSIIGGGQFIGTSTPELGGVMESLIKGEAK